MANDFPFISKFKKEEYSVDVPTAKSIRQKSNGYENHAFDRSVNYIVNQINFAAAQGDCFVFVNFNQRGRAEFIPDLIDILVEKGYEVEKSGYGNPDVYRISWSKAK